MTDTIRPLKPTLALALVQARFQLTEAVRIPVSILMTLAAPCMGLLFFVIPQREVATNPDSATQAVLALAIFGILANSLFHFAVEVAQARERPWGSYTRSLPTTETARIVSYLISSGILALGSVLPLALLAAFTTEARLSAIPAIGAVFSLILTSVPFMLIGMIIGYSSGSKAAVALAQVLMLLLAFGGGLFLPPMIFPDWLNAISLTLPSRSALEIVTWAAGFADGLPVAGLVGWVAWTALTFLTTVLLVKRDTDREYRLSA
ncbi:MULTISPECIES: ABC transporter permease [Auritidibacter]|uniref:ABC transporter permease n=1 Tax=Auritidibacter ignavus TaxID=678932 RepID=A0AAJ6AMS9_9MICC|nr:MULTISPECIES: ABC transporter permease [Auritidibacter]PXA79995.1 ABC transporter [Auritidibacter sp. NML120779]NIH72511.1 ABC-2 type transport system permease protein [Auritidibacter ignavus]PXA76869.1 ABC transporter [Auritidibacter sp. NML100628]RMX23134.1 ABC transporter permease [Auritidibacter ignavus]WGH83206.1 ABC transporter permease [Auritidibacter ignavus]